MIAITQSSSMSVTARPSDRVGIQGQAEGDRPSAQENPRFREGTRGRTVMTVGGCRQLVLSTSTKASCGMSTEPTDFMRFLPSRCFSRSLRLRLMSPP